jgi:hypothetical protein
MDSATRLPGLVATVIRSVQGEHTELEADRSMTSRLLSLAVLFADIGGFGAEFDERSIDGVRYAGLARSLESGKYYPVIVRFYGNHASVLLNQVESSNLHWMKK